MGKKKIITEFTNHRPPAIGSFGYGSAVFKQESYTSKDHPQIDVIFIVEDLKKWHQLNMQENPHDYSLLGKIHINRSSCTKLKGPNKITYYSQIKEGPNMFKYGVIEITDFLSSLDTWSNFFIAGRFQKPILEIKTTEKIEDSIHHNRESAILVASLFCDEITTKKDLFISLCGLSYLGTLRMSIAENPNKVRNIVEGSYHYLTELYHGKRDYLLFDGDDILINREKQLTKLNTLPSALLKYLETSNTDLTDIESIKTSIIAYLSKTNRREEIAQIIEGLKTNGIIRSTPYVASKLSKRFK